MNAVLSRFVVFLTAIFALSCHCDCACTSAECPDGVHVRINLTENFVEDFYDYQLKWVDASGNFQDPHEISSGPESDHELYFLIWDSDLAKAEPDEIEIHLYYLGEEVEMNNIYNLEWVTEVCNSCVGDCASCKDDMVTSAVLEIQL